MKKFIVIMLIVAVVLVALALIGWLVLFHPGEIESEKVVKLRQMPQLSEGQKIKILTWNVQFMAGKNYIFFFDLLDSSGPDERPSAQDIKATLKEVARVIKEENPDIILLQEVDDGCKRTDYRDQLADLLELLPSEYACYTTAYYWKAPFVPHPRILGAVGMKLAIISKYDISEAVRYQLAIPPANFVIQLLNTRRAVLEARMPLSNGHSFSVMSTHLDAFAQGSDTMERQVKRIKGILGDLDKQGTSFVIGGDFNLLPPGVAYDLLDKDQQAYFNRETEIKPLFDSYNTVPSLEEVNGDQKDKWFTHFPNDPAVKNPDRTIDYQILSKQLTVVDHYIRRSDTLKISDHFPVVTIVTIP